jgi:hypothetical protein
MKQDREPMHTLLRSCVVASAVCLLSIFVAANTALALTQRGYCVVTFILPFTNKIFEFPSWTWPLPMLIAAISALVALSLWATLIVKRKRGLNQVFTTQANRYALAAVVAPLLNVLVFYVLYVRILGGVATSQTLAACMMVVLIGGAYCGVLALRSKGAPIPIRTSAWPER